MEARDRHPEDPLPTSFLLQPPAHLPAEERSLFRQRFTVTLRDPDEPVEKMDPARRYLSGVGMLASNWAGWQILEKLDIPVDMLCGQSLGDISAMCAAHMVDFEEVIPRLWNYLDEDYRLPGTGCMAFVGASEERIAEFLERFEDVCVALYQSPETLVLGGTDDILDYAGVQGANVEVSEDEDSPVITTIEFKRKLNTGDQYDQIIYSGPNNIIWAYGREDSRDTAAFEQDYGTLVVD